jgi:hypothetical protein
MNQTWLLKLATKQQTCPATGGAAKKNTKKNSGRSAKCRIGLWQFFGVFLIEKLFM